MQLTEAIRVLLNERDFYVHVIEGSRYEAGDKIGYIKAVIDVVLERPDLGGGVERYLEAKSRIQIRSSVTFVRHTCRTTNRRRYRQQ